MGGLISTIRDLKIILGDLKVTLKFTAKIVLKVHGIVDDVEQTVQELKATVNNLSVRIPSQNSTQEKLLDETSATYLNEVVQNIETTAESVKTSLANAVSVLSGDDLLKNTSEALESLVNHSGKNLSGVMSRWANVPDEIGELVKQDCASLTEYIQKAKFSPFKATTNNDCQLLYTTQSTKDKNQLDLIKDIVDRSGKNTKPLVKENPIPSISLVEEISFTENSDPDRIFKIPIPLSISDYIFDASKCYSTKRTLKLHVLPVEEKNNNKMIDLMQDKNARKYHLNPESQSELPTEILSLLVMALVQVLASENTNLPQKAFSISRDSQKCLCLGKALMAEHLSWSSLDG